jgi:DNA mismatch repair protein MutS
VRDEGGEVTFLYKVLPGVSSRSYGIHVARLAGLPEEVVTHAESLLREPVSLPTQIPQATASIPMPREEFTPSPVEERLRRIDPLHTTPFEALQCLHELRELLMRGVATERPSSPAPR